MLKDVDRQLAEAETRVTQLRRALTIPLVQRSGEQLADFGNQVNEVAQMSEMTRKQLGPVLYADHQITPSEARILDMFSSRNDIDLTDLFVNLRQAGQTTDLSALMHEIESLYRKNRVIVRIRPRG